MDKLDNPIRDYAWGSRTQLAKFLSREAPGHPEAELWIGAHPGDPSRLADGQRLDEVIAANPGGMLGERVRRAFDDRMPFLMKVLAVNEPLSLQVHPSSVRATMGFSREESGGIPDDAPDRSYHDRSHKPELIYAMSRFEGMAGFRHPEGTAEILRLLDHPWADELGSRLTKGSAFQSLRRVVAETLRMPAEEVAELLPGLCAAATDAAQRAHQQERRRRSPTSGPSRVRREAIRVFEQLAALGATYPRDAGVLVTLLLHHVVLPPGEAMFLQAGVLHAYTAGFGVEIMASSDNVLRAGLTPKHRDIEELLRVTDFTPIPPPLWEPSESREDYMHLEPPVADFCLTVCRPPSSRLPADGPRVVLALDGAVEVRTAADCITLHRGDAVFVADEDGPFELAGAGQVAIGSVPAPAG